MFELSLLCPEERVETLSDALDALDALSVSVPALRPSIFKSWRKTSARSRSW